MLLKRIIMPVLTLIFMLLILPGCAAIGPDPEQLMAPPRLSGDNKNIQDALELAAGSDIIFKFPQNGDNRSAFIFFNWDEDGVPSRAIAFYATKQDSQVTHINFLQKEDEFWVSKGDFPSGGNDIDNVYLEDLRGDGSIQIITEWSMASNRERCMIVFSAAGANVKIILQENYTDYVIEDMDGDGEKEIVLFYLDTANKVSAAKMYKLENGEINPQGEVSLDGNITGYDNIKINPVVDGINGIYIDANKGSEDFTPLLAMITELVFWDGTEFRAPFFNSTTQTNTVTYRVYPDQSRDINGDGRIEIPLLIELPGYDEKPAGESVWFTDWKQYTDRGFNTVFTAAMNYDDGYYYLIPKDWKNSVTVVKEPKSKAWRFVPYDSEKNIQSEELLKIQVFTQDEWNDFDGSGYFLLSDTGEKVYAGFIPQNQSDVITQKNAKENFRLLEAGN